MYASNHVRWQIDVTLADPSPHNSGKSRPFPQGLNFITARLRPPGLTSLANLQRAIRAFTDRLPSRSTESWGLLFTQLRDSTMTISMYQASVPRLANVLGNLSNILDKAQAHVDAKKLDASTLMTYRLFPDMLPFTKQVQIACDKTRSVVARLAGLDVPVYEDNEKTLGELKVRIARTIAFIQSVSPAQIDGSEDREIVLQVAGS